MKKAPFIGELDPRDKPLFAATAEACEAVISVVTKMQAIEYDPAKRRLALDHRGLDMARAAEVFEGPTITVEDVRRDYSERRYLTIGYLDQRMVMLVWTPRSDRLRIISMRKTNDRETACYSKRMGRS